MISSGLRNSHDPARALFADQPSPESPIVLQEPPKAKLLKRQLSINTQEQTESLRIYKRPATQTRPTSGNHEDTNDDVTGSYGYSLTDFDQGGVYRRQDYRQTYGDVLPERDEVDGADATGSCAISTPNLIDRRRSSKDKLADESLKTDNVPYQRIPSVFCDETRDNIYENPPLSSPNRFNLTDISLTSPFLPRTSGGSGQQDDVFVYPEPARKVSPYKSSPTKSETHKTDADCGTFVRKRHSGECDYTQEAAYAHALPERDRERPIKRHGDERSINRHGEERSINRLSDERSINRHSDERSINRHADSVCFADREASNPEHVCPVKGFRFPKRPSITDPPQFSPRVVTTDVKPRFPSTSSTSGSRTQRVDYHARLRMLERECARAKQIYGSPPPSPDTEYRHISPNKSTLRSISDVARSANENEIRETAEDVQAKFMRSYSDPRSSPNQNRHIPCSPLVRAEQTIKPHPESESRVPTERLQDPWHDDVRRRLFMTNYNNTREYQRHSSVYDRLPPKPQASPSRVSTDIPEEVLSFLHSKNFHPEDLQNIKEFLRHGGSPSGSPSPSGGMMYEQRPSAVSSGRYQERGPGRPIFRHRPETSRDRPIGCIDVRLTCTDFAENTDLNDILRDLEHESKPCKCGRIESEMLKMIENAYNKIPSPENNTSSSVEQYHKEVEGTREMEHNALKLLCGIKCLCKYGRMLQEVYTGSVVFRLLCPNMDALLDLWHNYTLGNLQEELQEAFVTDELLDKFGCIRIKLKVQISREEFLECKTDLELQAEASITRTPTKQITVIHARSRSEPAFMGLNEEEKRVPSPTGSPFRDRFLSDSSMDSPRSPRRVFQELNAGKYPIHPPPAASKLPKFLPDTLLSRSDDVNRSPVLARRKLPPEAGQENTVEAV